VCVLGLGLIISSCKDADIAEPLTGVDSARAASVEMLPAERSLSFIGMIYQMRAHTVAANDSVLFTNTTQPDSFFWSSNAPDVVTVDQNGVVTARRVGTAKVSARSSGVTGTATVTVRDDIRVAWSLQLQSAARAWVTIGDDGTLYVGLLDPEYQTRPESKATVSAIAPDGTLRWSVHVGKAPNWVPAIGGDGTLYVGTERPDTSLIGVAQSGAVRWTATGLGPIDSSPVIAPDGTVYVASENGTLYAIDAAGRKKWAFTAGGRFNVASPALTQDGTIVVGREDGRLYAVAADGTEVWTFQVPVPENATRPPPFWGSPVIDRDGRIYFTPADEHLYALTPDGKLAWRLPLPIQSQGVLPPAIGADGTIYVAGDGLHAVDPSGQRRWTYPGPYPPVVLPFQPPIVAGDGSIYASVPFGPWRGVYALAPDGTLKWDYPTDGYLWGAPVIGLDGTIYAVATTPPSSPSAPAISRLHALVERNGSNGGYANAPWPKARGNRANTGRAGSR
jgi:outer membrane protein assembly factor BamB